ncbi:hypothetical protein BRADI_2g18851v3 [Brachypodium distachyon]|uniref:Uncharacterized protein n=1 Tax=Brachypodium distachyon TaxID=15368 RepID=A0A0Q3G1A4_BRADI|nr:hypothetical protein BRADI_2g18851v3 [Brachypodium distachyon]
MEALISAVLGDLLGKAISFVVDKCREQAATAEGDPQRLQLLLMRTRTIVEEAEGRSVTNQGMIHQVGAMRERMYRGYYLLDFFRCKGEKAGGDDEVSRCLFAPSEFNPAKRLRRVCSSNPIGSIVVCRESSKELKNAILDIENMVTDMKEFAIFLMSYPRMYRQPNNSYLFLGKCMFGRHMEKEQTISFLLQAEPLGSGNLGVLPIVGPAFIGKSTLVEHVCYDERVHNHFSLILLYHGNNLKDETGATFRDNCVIKHQNTASDEERLLLLGDVDQGAWKRLLHSSEGFMTCGSKVIITSRSEKVVSLGTTEAVRLKCLSKEAFWYFFKTIVFGSTDPDEHPKLTSIAMELALDMPRSFMCAYVVAALLRAANLSVRSWCKVHTHFREYIRKNTLLFGEFPEDDQPRHIWSMEETQQGSENLEFFLLGDSYQKGPAAHSEVPQITVVDLVCGTRSVRPRGRFEVLFWRSCIPPYYSYASACEFVRHKNTATA